MSGFMSALSDPGVDALLGAASGFASAAMPTRMPTPWGAALGMGGSGALSGLQTSQQLQQGTQALQAAKMQNTVAASALPLTVARNQALLNFWNNPGAMTGTPGAAPAPGAPAPAVPVGSSTVPAPDVSKLNAFALSSLPDDNTRKLASNAIMASGLPQEAVAPWISTVHNESGWNLAAPDNENTNGSFDRGPGQINSRTASSLGLTPEQLADPQTNLNASAKYFGQQWVAAHGDPAAAIGGYHSPAGTAPDLASYTAKGMNRLAGWGYGPQATQSGPDGQPVTSQSALAIAQSYTQQANDLETAQKRAAAYQAMGVPPIPGTPAFPPPGDPTLLRTMAGKYTDLALAGPTQSAKSVAQSQNSLTYDRYGNAYRLGKDGTTWEYMGRGAEVKPIAQGGKIMYGDVGGTGIGAQAPAAGPTTGTPQEAPNQLEANIQEGAKVLGGAGIVPGVAAPVAPNIAAVPLVPAPPQVGAAPATPIPGNTTFTADHPAPGITMHAMPGGGTAVTDTRKEQNEAYQKDLTESAQLENELQSTQQGQQRTLEMRNVIAQLPQSGPLGTQRAAIASFIQTYMPSLAPTFNSQSSLLPEAKPAAILAKLQLQTAGMQEREAVGARGGARLTEMYKNANPNLDMVPDANREIANLQAVAQQMDMDYGRGLQTYINTNGNKFLTGQSDYLPSSNFDNEWLKQRNPQVYLGATMAMSGRPWEDWTKGLAKDEIGRAVDVIRRVDPSSQIIWQDGQPHTFPAQQQATATPSGPAYAPLATGAPNAP